MNGDCISRSNSNLTGFSCKDSTDYGCSSCSRIGRSMGYNSCTSTCVGFSGGCIHEVEAKNYQQYEQ